MSTHVNSYDLCRSIPSIPFTGRSKFEFDTSQFTELSINQKTIRNRRNLVMAVVSTFFLNFFIDF